MASSPLAPRRSRQPGTRADSSGARAGPAAVVYVVDAIGKDSPWGSETPIRTRTARYDRPMWSLLYLVVRSLVRLPASGGRGRDDDRSKDLESLVLRPQLRVL